MNAIEKQRIDYVDLLKGFAMVMVIAGHCDLFAPDLIRKQLLIFRMPLYFFLAGMFVTGRRSIQSFIIHKINRIIVPAIFFSLLALMLSVYFLPTNDLYKALQKTNNTILPGPIYFIYSFLIKEGGYIWFLRCIFFTTIFFHIIIRKTTGHTEWIKALVILISGAIGFGCLKYSFQLQFGFNDIPFVGSLIRFIYYIKVPLALAMLPITYAGYLAVHIGIQDWRPTIIQAAMIMLCTYAFSTIVMFCQEPAMYKNVWPIECYPMSLTIVAFFVTLAKIVNYIPIINYLGQNTLIALGMHYFFGLIWCKLFGNASEWPKFAVVLTLTLLSIYPLRRWVPWLTGYADLIRPIKTWRVFSTAKG